jgi:hypothetical protein
MPKTYVSIDFDFWNDNPELAYEEVDDLLGEIALPKSSLVGVMNHQQMLPYVNKSGASKLINVDYHSDASHIRTLASFNCGTWVSYIDWSDKGTYVWIRPTQYTFPGNCNGTKGRWDIGIGWKKSYGVFKKDGKNAFAKIKKSDIIGVGLCLSPAYIESDILESTFRVLLDKYDITYKKGIRHERHEAYRIPPVSKRKK